MLQEVGLKKLGLLLMQNEGSWFKVVDVGMVWVTS